MKIGILGLGYVGFPLAEALAKHHTVKGFDVNERKVAELQAAHSDIELSASQEILADCDVYIVAVPTPITKYKTPDLSHLVNASSIVAKYLKSNNVVIFESTVFPGCTEEDCVPVLEQISGLKVNVDFGVGYSPERINPGDQVHTLKNTPKIVSASSDEYLSKVRAVYEDVVDELVPVTSIKVAEAAKILENTQRDLNIALMNELSLIFDRMGINTIDVIEAAATKWNFQKFYPGLVGGHCISVDPYYLVFKAIELGYRPEVILSGRRVNDNLSKHVVKKAILFINDQDVVLNQAKVLVYGVAFKENVGDVRNSKILDVISELQGYGVQVDIVDAHVDVQELANSYNQSICNEPKPPYHCVIVATKHTEYLAFDQQHFDSILTTNGGLIDIKGLYRERVDVANYFML